MTTTTSCRLQRFRLHRVSVRVAADVDSGTTMIYFTSRTTTAPPRWSYRMTDPENGNLDSRRRLDAAVRWVCLAICGTRAQISRSIHSSNCWLQRWKLVRRWGQTEVRTNGETALQVPVSTLPRPPTERYLTRANDVIQQWVVTSSPEARMTSQLVHII